MLEILRGLSLFFSSVSRLSPLPTMYRHTGTKLVGRISFDRDMNDVVSLVIMLCVSLSPATHLVLMAWQYHPEFKSRPGQPSPLFTGLLRAAGRYADQLL